VSRSPLSTAAYLMAHKQNHRYMLGRLRMSRVRLPHSRTSSYRKGHSRPYTRNSTRCLSAIGLWHAGPTFDVAELEKAIHDVHPRKPESTRIPGPIRGTCFLGKPSRVVG